MGALQKLGQVGFAQFVDIVEFAVGKQAGPADSVKDIAGLTFNALLAGADRAMPLVGHFAFFQQQNVEIGMFRQIIG